MLDGKVLELKDEIIEKVRECVRIRSVMEAPQPGMPFGQGVHSALQYTLGLAGSLGFRTVNMDNMIGYAEYGTGEEMIAVLGHIDVVPEGGGWIYPPYAAEIHDGKIYGRGVLDDKGATIGALYALKAIKDSGIQLKRRVRIIFGTNEENGSKCAKYYAENDETPVAGFTPDASYPIINGEKGIVNCTFRKALSGKAESGLLWIKGGTAVNSVPDYAEAAFETGRLDKDKLEKAAKEYGDIEISGQDKLLVAAHGKTAHGGTPEEGVNAISVLMGFLKNFELKGKLEEFVEFYNKYIGFTVNGELLGIGMQDEVSGKLTVNTGTISGSGDAIDLRMNLRYPVTKRYEDFSDKFFALMESQGFESIDIVHKKCLFVSPETDFIKKLQKVYTEKTGKEARLISYSGGTYAKALKNIVAFGPLFEGEPDLCHQANEHMSIENLIKNVQIIAAAIHELAN
ncbi:MAG TPA: dipeptidase PepV [Clostridia bacterium]|nr:dipeptidase PepV [Clostridia bacterium]